MEQPEDPAVHSVEPTADICSTIGETNAAQAFQHAYGLLLTSFPQSALGGRNDPKWTTLMHRHLGGLRQLAQLEHDDTVAHTHVHSSNTARWAPGPTQASARQLAKALPEMNQWANQASTDRPRDTVAAPAKHHTPDIQVTIGHKQRPLRDGRGKPSPGRKHPTQRSHPPRGLGTALLAVATTEMATSPEVRTATLDLAGGRCKKAPTTMHTWTASAPSYPSTPTAICTATQASPSASEPSRPSPPSLGIQTRTSPRHALRACPSGWKNTSHHTRRHGQLR
jgi:hypothetical protein